MPPKSLVGKVVYGSWNDGSDVYKDSKGYYVVQYSPSRNETYKKHLKRWKPAPDTNKLCMVGKKWKRCGGNTTRRRKSKD